MKISQIVAKASILIFTMSGTLVGGSNIVGSADSTTSSTPSEYVQKNSKLGPGYYNNSTNNKVNRSARMAETFSTRSSTDGFLAAIKPGAINTWSKYQVLPSITAAQAILESGWGSSGLAVQANNLFGIKGSYNGQSVTMTTKEEDANGNPYYVNAQFRKYPDWATSVEDHGNFFHDNSRYHNILGLKDYKQEANLIQQDGYATAVDYASSLINLIQQYGLDQWDQEAFNQTTFPMKPIDMSVATVKFVSGYGINAYDDSGNYIDGSRDIFKDGTAWKVGEQRMINGQEMLQVATNEWIPRQYTNLDASVITVNAIPQGGVNTYDLNGNFTGTVLTSGTQWKSDQFATINGQRMYRVATNMYIPERWTQFGPGK
ncbi:glycoside hydrolase family 73 protein [Lactiplantibacillus paraplantarum]|uniref:glycoside hydrolase family 73 protein n=1 Tax=Lactiplantibacillus paraplantarum TaxID=60520 RepID=UPI0007E4A372|nr:glycoside hydrolase family 73 protein [Lactiplantibacillus paraplantarum]MCW1911175.1 glycoside hydrolase family 73 protein [Lactiplantibacillus paraplantarum]OAX76047.1 hypothetical protein A0U96_13140 [Lactiplantibacillus plantarum]